MNIKCILNFIIDWNSPRILCSFMLSTNDTICSIVNRSKNRLNKHRKHYHKLYIFFYRLSNSHVVEWVLKKQCNFCYQKITKMCSCIESLSVLKYKNLSPCWIAKQKNADDKNDSLNFSTFAVGVWCWTGILWDTRDVLEWDFNTILCMLWRVLKNAYAVSLCQIKNRNKKFRN